MTDDKIASLKKRLEATRADARSKLQTALGDGRARETTLDADRRSHLRTDQLSLQAASAAFENEPHAVAFGAAERFGDETQSSPERPAAPIGSWRCIVNSPVVSIDLIANIAEGGTLSAQGTLIYTVTHRMFQVSGQGDWATLPPDETSSNWLFKFRLHPSNHAIFSWFAGPTSSPNHLHNRFTVPRTGGVVETRCERQS